MQRDVGNNITNVTGSAYVDSLYSRKAYGILYRLQERTSEAKPGFSMLTACCVNGLGCVWTYGEFGDERRFLNISI